MQITVVGAGVSGLVTARTLEERGHDVTLVTAATWDATVSDVAGAIWFPYQAGPRERVAQWAATTRRWLEEIARESPQAGVDVLTGYEITPTDERPWWAAVVDVARAPAPVIGAPMAWQFVAPRVVPSLFLRWITADLRGHVEVRAVTELATLPGDVVVNCTGLGARALCGDPALVPLLGQILVTAPGAVDLAVSITDDRDPEDLFYVIPRRRELVLGGCALPYSPDDAPWPKPDPEITARISRHAAALGIAYGTAPGDVFFERTGLRPYRPEVRLERDPHDARVIHNYGHGGAGFTLARGCALEVAALCDQILMTPP